MFRKILVPIDGSAASMRALDAAIELAEATHSTLVIMSVVGAVTGWVSGTAASAAYLLEEATRALERERSELLRQAMAMVPDSVPCMKVLTTGEPDAMILSQLEHEDYDMIVLGSRGLGGVSSTVMGSVSKQVLRRAKVPVLVVRAQPGDADWLPPERAAAQIGAEEA